MKKGEWALVVVLILFGVSYHAIEQGKSRLAGEYSFYSSGRRLQGSFFQEIPEAERSFANVTRVVIDNPAGEVLVARSADDRVHLSSRMRVYSVRKAGNGSRPKPVTIRVEQTGGVLRVDAQGKGDFPFASVRLFHSMQVPAGVELQIANREGSTIVRDVQGEVAVEQENGKLIVDRASASVKAQLLHCRAALAQIGARVDITMRHSNLEVDGAKALKLKSRHGDCVLKNIGQDAVIEHERGRLVLDGALSLEIRGRHSRIAAKNIQQGAVIANQYESVLLEDAGGDIRLDCRLSRVDLRRIAAGRVSIENAYAGVHGTGLAAEQVDILLKNGNLDLGFEHIAERINIESRYATLRLSPGPASDATVSIRARHGRILAPPAFGLDVFVEKSETFANRSGGKPEILINSVYGDIHIDGSK